ncbi:MAG: YncE family protein [Bacteroidetes bacterium]|nr:YncE family protein [Bacteroidota bacterium]
MSLKDKIINRSKIYIKSSGLSFLVFIGLIIYLLPGCSKEPIREVTQNPPVDTSKVTYNNGVFVVNEGNFNWINASVTYIDNKSGSVYQDIFNQANNRGLGDVAQSMKVLGSKGFIIVNNNDRIEVVSLKDFRSIKSITGFNSPRYIEFIDSSKAYVTNMRKNISVVNLKTMTIEKDISTPYWTESLLHYGQYMFVTCIGSFNESSANRKAQVYVVDTRTDKIIDSIMMGKEPVSITVDRKNKIWVICTGGYDNYEAPTLKRIDPALMIVEKTFTFPVQQGVPSKLCMNPTRDTLYFINGGVFQMSANATELPAQALIPANGHLFYGLDVNPQNGLVYVSDAVNYVQSGYVFKCSQSSGQILNTYLAGRIPGSFCFTSSSKK